MRYIYLLLGILMTTCVSNRSRYYPKQQLTDIRSGIKEKDLPINCKGLTKIVEEQWFYDNKNDYYVHDSNFVGRIQQYSSCLKQLSPNQIKAIFGKPNREDIMNTNQSLCYYTDTLCYYSEGCIPIVFFSYDGKKIHKVGY
ncbi:MAG: hypothetical protein AB8G11_24075 [Saprospiraceae bacterium]